MHRDVRSMTEEDAATVLRRFRRAFSAADAAEAAAAEGATSPATGFHDARDSVREAAARGRGTRTDRAYRRGLRGRGQR